MLRTLQKSISIALILAFVNGCARDAKNIIPGEIDTAEARLGAEIHNHIIQSMPVYREPLLNEYVQNIGIKLADTAERKDLFYRFLIL